jgi:hypothetical protein
MGVTIRSSGNRAAEVRRETARLAARLNAETAEEAAARARELCPVRTGALRSSIAVAAHPSDGSAEVSAGGGAVDYAVFVEADQPFFMPAVEAARRR